MLILNKKITNYNVFYKKILFLYKLINISLTIN